MRSSFFAAVVALTLAPALASAQPAPSTSVSSTPPAAPKKDEARKHFEEGLSHFDRGEWSAALAEFLTSRSLFATRAATKDAAICLRKEGRFDEALDMWDALEREFPDLAPEDRAIADSEIADLRRSVGAVTLRGGEPGANVVIDGRARGVLPLAAPLRVSAGSHGVRVYKEGFAAFEARIDVAGQATVAVDVHLDALMQSGRLRVTEQEQKPVEVVVDNVDVGAAPWEGSLAIGDHMVILRGEGTLGTEPVSAPIHLNQLTPLTLIAENLDASARVDPIPGGASVVIDGVAVGRGVWDGRLRIGGHKIEVAEDGFFTFSEQISLERGERKVVTALLERDPRSALWGESARPRFVFEVDGAFVATPVLGGQLLASCTGTCSASTAIGGLGVLHAAYQLPVGVGFGVDGGYLAFSSSLSRRAVQFMPNGASFHDNGTVDDKLSSRGLVIGGSAFFHLGETWPLTLRLGIGAMLANVRDQRTGNFTDSKGAPFSVNYADAPSAAYFYVAPEVRFGRRLGDHLELTVGVELRILTAVSQATWSDAGGIFATAADGEGGFSAQTLAGTVLFIVAPGLGARYDF
jgi:PEGA domain